MEIGADLALHDGSGVSHVMAVFAHANPGAFTCGDPTSRYEDQGSPGADAPGFAVVFGCLWEEDAEFFLRLRVALGEEETEPAPV